MNISEGVGWYSGKSITAEVYYNIVEVRGNWMNRRENCDTGISTTYHVSVAAGNKDWVVTVDRSTTFT